LELRGREYVKDVMKIKDPVERLRILQEAGLDPKLFEEINEIVVLGDALVAEIKRIAAEEKKALMNLLKRIWLLLMESEEERLRTESLLFEKGVYWLKD
jgi:hypothetical protein